MLLIQELEMAPAGRSTSQAEGEIETISPARWIWSSLASVCHSSSALCRF